MRREAAILACWLAAGPWAAVAARAGALRALAFQGKTCWAAGDAGALLRSDDAGKSWRRLRPPVAANFQCVQVARRGVYFFGGRAVPGHPAGQGSPAILRTSDGGATFAAVPAGAAGWLYGGCFAGKTAVAYGQAGAACPGGALRTIDGGKLWGAASITTTGALTAGAFRTPRYACLVGPGRRIVHLRDLAEPRLRASLPRAGSAFRAVRFAGANTSWCVGNDAAVLRSASPGRPWDPIPLPLPPGARRGADLEALAFASSDRGWLGGGLIGVVARTQTGGTRWRLLPAPAPGALHALAWGGGGVLLAAGDAERIWRSTDGGQSWRLVHGAEQTDVLFVIAAGDYSAYPAIAAHALAGASVAVVFATHLPSDRTPADQPLRAAAALAGADGVAVLTEFASVAADPAAAELTDRDLLRRWSIALDTPADAEIVRQLAAAIRLYRPAVLAVGPDAPGARGRLAEARMVAGLAPWRVRRTFVGLEANEQWAAPWRRPAPVDRRAVAAAFDAARFPGEGKTPLGLLAARAVWALPGTGLLDRPGEAAAYRCEQLDKRVRLFTTGLADRRLVLTTGSAAQRDLATCASLRMGVARNQTYAATVDVIAAFNSAGSPESTALAADRLMLCWWRLLAEGRLVEADEALAVLLAKDNHHPLGGKLRVLALAKEASGEWRAQLRGRGLGRAMKPGALQAAVTAFAREWPWSLTPDGQMLLARGLAATGQAPAARKVLGLLSQAPQPAHWRRCALLELGPAAADAALRGRRHVAAAYVTERGRFDGRLDEACWTTSRPWALRPPAAGSGTEASTAPAGPQPPAPSIQAVRSSGGFVIFGVRLPQIVGRRWELDVAIDADRDTWTQIVLHWQTGGPSSARLALRHGPTADLGPRAFTVRAAKGADQWTLEIAMPLRGLSLLPPTADVWNFQVRAAAHDMPGTTRYYFQPQADPRLLPERYGLLRVPGADGAPAGGASPSK